MSDSTPKESEVPPEPTVEIPDRSVTSPAPTKEESKPKQTGDETPVTPKDGTIAITPWFSSSPPTSQALYTKAASHNETLTALERLYLLSRLDLPGKAISSPDDLTIDEINQLLGRPPRVILEKNIRRFFKPPSSGRPSSDDKGDKPEGAPEIKTIADVVKTYHKAITSDDPTQAEKVLTYDAAECISCGWWTLSQDRPPNPWEDDSGSDKQDEVAARAAADLLSGRISREEREFEQKVTDLFCGGGSDSWAAASAGLDEEQEEEEDYEAREEMYNLLVRGVLDDVARLRGELLVLVREKLEGLDEEGRKELVELRERERLQLEKEREGERLEKQKRKLEREEEDEERKKRRAGKKRPTIEGDEGGHVGGDEEDDGEEGYVLGSLVFDD